MWKCDAIIYLYMIIEVEDASVPIRKPIAMPTSKSEIKSL